ncbi:MULTISPECIES: hypothetical protein [unclassified Saccharicrinis]|uniref:hypothetical protein n=1 Tax=unclassified Saccharicrinis TaxID=2646859 RepID=UPI003D347A60
MDKPFSVEMKDDSDIQEMIISGDLIINHADTIKEELLKTLDFSKKLHIKVDNPTRIDITFIQLVLAIKMAYKNKRLDFNLEGTFNDEACTLVANAGFNDLFKL